MIAKILNKPGYWFIKYICSRKFFAGMILKPALHFQSWLYHVISACAVTLNQGIHPKHRILSYKEWFLDNICPGQVVLDIGCNTGIMPELFSVKAAFVYGVEINPRLVEEAKANHQQENIKFICADATKYDYTHCQSIDCVTLSNVLEHIEYRVDFLKNLVAVIKKNNSKKFLVLIRVPLVDRDWLTVYKKELGMNYKLDEGHYTEYTLDQFQQEMIDAGITIKQHQVRFGELYTVCTA